MSKLTDGKRTVNIELKVWEGNGYSPDWSDDFFNVGLLPYDREADTFTVDDVEYCLEQAYDWKYSVGDYCDDIPNENNEVFVEEIK